MDTQSLHTLFTAVLAFGILLAGLGGFGLQYFSRLSAAGKESRRAAGEGELLSKIYALQKEIEELEAALRASDRTEPGKPAVSEAAAPTPSQGVFQSPPEPIPVRTSPPPLAGWAGESLLEEMIVSSIADTPQGHPTVSDNQRRMITGILRKYADRSIAIHSVAGDDAGFNLAWALKAAFVEAGWRVEGVEQVAYANPPAGLFITSGTASSPEEAIIPHDALTTAGFEVSRCVDSNLKGAKTVLLVGIGPA